MQCSCQSFNGSSYIVQNLVHHVHRSVAKVKKGHGWVQWKLQKHLQICHPGMSYNILLYSIPPFIGASLLSTTWCKEEVEKVKEGYPVNIPCDIDVSREVPFWIINQLYYDASSIPSFFDAIMANDFKSFEIPEVTRAMNDTTFQCIGYKGNEKQLGIITKLVVDIGNSLHIVYNQVVYHHWLMGV